MSIGMVAENPEVVLKTAKAEGARSTLWHWAALGTILLASCGHLLIKVGVTAAAHGAPATGLVARILHYFLEPATIAGLVIYGAGTLLWIYAVSQRNISFLYPLTALAYVIVAVGGRFMFAENISPGRWAGIGVVMLGVAMLQLSAKREEA